MDGTDGTNGTNGTDGKSALDILIEAGELPTGSTVTDLVNYLKGKDGVDGANGTNGTDGKSALDLLIEAGELPSGSTVTDMVNYLKGKDGVDGASLDKPMVTENSADALKGTAHSGETVVVVDGSGNVIAMAETAANGSFEFIQNGQSYNPLADQIGSIYVEKTETKADGSVVTYSSDAYTLVGAADTLAPELAEILVNNATALSGTAEAGSIISLTVDGEKYTTVTDATGHWTFNQNPLIGTGIGIIQVTDQHGNHSDPALLQIGGANIIAGVIVLDDTDIVDGVINAKELGSDQSVKAAVVLDIEAKEGDTVIVNGIPYVVNKTDLQAGQLVIEVPVREGDNRVVVTAKNAEGQSDQFDATITVDTHIDAIQVTQVESTAGLTQADKFSQDLVVNAQESGEVRLSGIAEPNSTLQLTLLDGSAQPWSGQFQVAADGRWSVVLPDNVVNSLPEGVLPLEIVATDAFGNTAKLHNTEVSIDRQGPAVDINVDADGKVSILNAEDLYLANGDLVTLTDLAQRLTATNVAGDFTVITNNGVEQIQFTPTDASYSGAISIQLAADVVFDVAGNSNAAAQDTTPPTVLIQVADNTLVAGETTIVSFSFSERVTGFDLTDVAFDSTQGSLSHLVQDLNNPLLYTAVFTPNAVNNLNVSFSIAAASYNSLNTGKGGFAGQLNAAILGDTLLPVEPVLRLVVDSGVSATDGITNIGLINVTQIELGNPWQYSVDGGLNWSTGSGSSFTLLPFDKTYSTGQILVKQQDAAGNVTQGMLKHDVVFDTMTSVIINSVAGDGIIDIAEQKAGYIVKGTAEPSATVTLTVGGHTATVKANSQGNWVYEVPALVAAAGSGAITVNATAQDLAGNIANTMSTPAIYGDATTKSVSIDLIAGDDIINATEKLSAVTIGGGALSTTLALSVDATIKNAAGVAIYKLLSTGWNTLGGGQVIGSDGVWTSTLAQTDVAKLADGVYTIEASSGSATATRTFTVDSKIDMPLYQVKGNDQLIANALTNDATPTWSNVGSNAEVGATIEVIIDGVSYGKTVVASDGSWSITANQPVADGTHNVVIKATDIAGNSINDSKPLTIDTVPPQLTIDPITGDNIVTKVDIEAGFSISGTASGAEIGQTVALDVDGVQVNASVTDAAGHWSVTLTPDQLKNVTVADGLTIQATVSDKAGNSTTSKPLNVQYLDNVIVELNEVDLRTADTLVKTGVLTVPADVESITLDEPLTQLYVNDVAVVWSGQHTQKLVGQVNGVEVIRLTIDDAGNYNVVLSSAIQHGLPNSSTDKALAFDIRADVVSNAANSSKFLTINVLDDAPNVAASAAVKIVDDYTAQGQIMLTYGADEGFIQTVNVAGASFVFDPESNTLLQTQTSSEVLGYAYNYQGMDNGALIVSTASGETISLNLVTGVYQYSVLPLSDALAASLAAINAPAASVGGSGSLLGAVGLNVAGLVALQSDQLYSVKGKGFNQVKIGMGGLDLGNIVGGLLTGSLVAFTYNKQLAQEFGYLVTVETGLLTRSLTIKTTDGSQLDAFKVNQLLATVSLDGGLSGTVDLSVLPTLTIEANNVTTVAGKEVVTKVASDSSTELANVGLLTELLSGEKAATTQVDQVGMNSDLIVKNSQVSNSLYGLDGDDKLTGGMAADLLYGGRGNDTISGGLGNDVIVGGQGNDILTGGEGADTFRWEKDNQRNGLKVAHDRITDFDLKGVSLGGDILDFTDMLDSRAGRLGFNTGNLTNYLHFEYDQATAKTTIYISTNGQFVGGFNPTTGYQLADQIIDLDNVNLLKPNGSLLTTDSDVIAWLIQHGKLSTNLLNITSSSNKTDLNVIVQDNDGDTASTGTNATLTFDRQNINTDIGYDPNNEAPMIFGKDNALLGLISLDALHVLKLGAQDIYVYDVNSNLTSVEISFDQIVAVNVSNPDFIWSTLLATELGLKAEVVHNEGLLGLVGKNTTLKITSASTGLDQTMSNAAINQFLATIKFGSRNEDGSLGIINGDLLSLDVLNALTVTATDSQNTSTQSSLANLLDLSLITSSGLNGNVNLIEGTQSDDLISMSNESKSLLIYGYNGADEIRTGSGDDVIYAGKDADQVYAGVGNDYVVGGAGNDILHGEAGNDALLGGDGNDTLYGGQGNNTMNGGAGNDTFISENGGRDTVIYDLLLKTDATGGHGQDTWTGFTVGNVALNANADVLDISALLQDEFDQSKFDYLLENSNDSTDALNYLGTFVHVDVVGNDTVISIDRDGAATSYNPTPLLTLSNVDTSLEQLLKNDQLIY